MGAWNTVHLFDDKIFFNETAPKLRGEKEGIRQRYDEHLKFCTNWTCDTLLEKLISVSQEMDKHFTKYPGFKPNEDLSAFFRAHKWTYDFAHFFEMMVFSECADFFPYGRLGKSIIANKLIYNKTSMSHEIIGILAGDDRVFNCEGFGVTGWITAEEAELLLLDIERVEYKGNENDRWWANEFIQFLKIGVAHNKGLITGRDLHDQMIKKLPPYKLVPESVWQDHQNEILIYK